MEYFFLLTDNTHVSQKLEEEISKINTSDLNKISSHIKICKSYIQELKLVQNEITEKLTERILSFGIKADVS